MSWMVGTILHSVRFHYRDGQNSSWVDDIGGTLSIIAKCPRSKVYAWRGVYNGKVDLPASLTRHSARPDALIDFMDHLFMPELRQLQLPQTGLAFLSGGIRFLSSLLLANSSKLENYPFYAALRARPPLPRNPTHHGPEPHRLSGPPEPPYIDAETLEGIDVCPTLRDLR
ncbi:hypothetical protein C8R43DRAFT_1233457 [Mycena crocata]|nr:hypothetical protein C8R43DRAFT_1233457 [Mycena crocata]